jgi:hypothetical protein
MLHAWGNKKYIKNPSEETCREEVKVKKGKAVKAHKVVRRRGSHI